jgi:GT2 family glycosyltransferase
MFKPVVIVPNWNGSDTLDACLKSLQAQSVEPHIIVVDNGSVDKSIALIENHYPNIELIKNSVNLGYAGGVNPGFKRAIELGAVFAAPFNNDATADKDWLKGLVNHMEKHPKVGIVACRLLNSDGSMIDSTGECYTSWGLPYPRGRGNAVTNNESFTTEIFGASGGASLYRVSMLREIGLLDADFFAYYEDVDISFRAQLAGWKVNYASESIAYHQIGLTSNKIPGFITYQTMKNLPWLFWKNVPARYLFRISWRFRIAYVSFLFSAIARGQGGAAIKGALVSTKLLPKKLFQRHKIQSTRKVKPEYIWRIITHDLPPEADRLRSLRGKWWKMSNKRVS